jgi:hypothetical protein
VILYGGLPPLRWVRVAQPILRAHPPSELTHRNCRAREAMNSSAKCLIDWGTDWDLEHNPIALNRKAGLGILKVGWMGESAGGDSGR